MSAALLALGTATLYEASGLDCILPHRIRPAWPGAALAGTALTVSAPPGDNLALHLALEHAEPGDVLVVDGGGEPFGYWGEVLAEAALARGVTGLVIDGGVRDVERLRDLPFPAFSTWTAIRGTVKHATGPIGAPLPLGAVTVYRGDMIVADADGIVALPAAELARITAAAEARASAESEYLRRIRAGASTMDIYGFGRP
ncbi:4-carboxy-4-hydroxy-2-oxoadipate aldolase/oxaloacetate decarboxylase [Dactylosporangium sp. NPDC049525]|uniref:4-carboxy-4-hydroxy-2-oxoadipate aldolase/oxaloacetate decarboxylase n=1 Tax=Dactylosporangium sp. NPDC049525 TaxID=3154730 RepID=UPI00342AF918